MEKRLHSSLQTSADVFLTSATKHSLKTLKPTIKTLINNIKSTSDLTKSLPISLHSSISKSINSFKLPAQNPPTPSSPPSKKPRKTPRNVSGNTHETPLETHQRSHLLNLQTYSYIALVCLRHPESAFSADDLFPCVRELHDNLVLFENDGTLLSEIANLCEQWWKGGFGGRELLISQFVPFLVSRSLTVGKKADVHRVYGSREAFLLFDFDDESIEDMKLLLVRCVICPLYLKTDDGRKFIAFMFGLSVQLLKEVLNLIKSQIPFGKKSVLEAYGEIVFRGWKCVDGVFRKEIEDGFLQGLIESAVLARSGSLAASVRRVLGGFINQRTTDGVEKLLFRLAEPVIFRSLQVANSNVRHNTLHLLLDLFPLEDPDATKEDKDSLLDKQFYLLGKLLKDDCPDVRRVAVEGVCRILHLFWEIIPSSTITKFLTIIFDDMSYDVSSDVRVSTLNGVIYLLGNPQAHEILKVLLPRLGNMISDSSVSVRLTLTDLLLLILEIRGFQFNKVVDLDVLLTALANDQPPVAQKITMLLLPSYFPAKVSIDEACTRFVTLIKRSPMAGARFCAFVGLRASSKSLVELVRVLTNMVLSSNKLDANLIKGMFLAITHLCSYLVKSSRREIVKEIFSGERLSGLLSAAILSDAHESLFDIVCVVAPSGFSALRDTCIDVVTHCDGLSEKSERQAKVRSAHKLALSCNWFDNMFEALSDLLQVAVVSSTEFFSVEIPKELTPSTKRKKGKSKMSGKGKSGDGKMPQAFKDNYQVAAGIAWQIKDLLASKTSRKAMFESQALKKAAIALKFLSEVSLGHCMCCDIMDVSLIDAYMKLSLYMTLESIDVCDSDDHDSRMDIGLDYESCLEDTVLGETLNHLLSCIEKVLNAGGLARFGWMASNCKQCSHRANHSCRKKQMRSDTRDSHAEDGTSFQYNIRVMNMVKILTAFLKFVVDVAALGFLSQYQQRCLKFTSMYLQNIISTLKRCFREELKFQDEQLKVIYVYVKSSFSYSAKLLNIVLKSATEGSPDLHEVHQVANYLLDLIASIELYVGSGYASQVVTLVKLWLPDMILALGSTCLFKQSIEEITSLYVPCDREIHIHPWLSILANIEVYEVRSDTSDEEEDKTVADDKFPAYKKLIGMMVQLLNMKTEVLDSVGLMFLIVSASGLQKKDFGLVLGLAHFVLVKLVKNNDVHWEKLTMMLAYVPELYRQVESWIEEVENNGDNVDELLRIKTILEPIWLYSCEMRDKF